MANNVSGQSTICVKGILTDEGVECQALRSDDGELYTLIGDLKDFHNGDRVIVCGTIVEISFCMQGTTMAVSWIGPESHAGDKMAALKTAPRPFKEGAPIIVGGGASVRIFFNSEVHYKPTGRPNEFAHPTDEVHAAYLYNRFGVPQDLTSSMAGKNATLTVSCEDSTGLDSSIIIDGLPGGPLRIRFRVSDYPFDTTKHIFFSPDRTLKSIQLKDNSSPNPPQTLLADPLGHVEIINSLPL